MTPRDATQLLTAVVTVITILILFGMVKARVLSWRYIILPILVSVQRVLFYLVVFKMDSPPSETVTMWSAILSLETGMAFLIVLLVYWKAHRQPHG